MGVRLRGEGFACCHKQRAGLLVTHNATPREYAASELLCDMSVAMHNALLM